MVSTPLFTAHLLMVPRRFSWQVPLSPTLASAFYLPV
jgi:hypothetical protein